MMTLLQQWTSFRVYSTEVIKELEELGYNETHPLWNGLEPWMASETARLQIAKISPATCAKSLLSSLKLRHERGA